MVEKKQRLVFFYENKRYEGYIIEDTPSHFKIKDTISDKEFWLPKILTKVEVPHDE